MLNPGKYHPSKALKGELREGQKAPYVAVEFQTPAGTIWWNGSLSETEIPNGMKVCDITIRDLLACGWDGKDIAALVGLGTKEVELVVVHKPDNRNNGQIQAKVKYINRPGEGGSKAKAAEASTAKQLNASLRGRVLDMQKRMADNDAKRAEKSEDTSFNYGAGADADL